ncbi:DEAD/DEAH box helicase [Oceanobacillus senegalensis]|uniref:DEAD/DEAH box helicase n=1 Tax=Oceanobacillus senegalensis TaxID=1936063 RepID=UPI000A3125C3|nr:DEAD/DEAH box helicase [Oceanobacillus senegalensis]
MKWSLNDIKERCGVVSFKRGDAFCRSGKVEIISSTSSLVEATVKGREDFHVHIEEDSVGGLRTSCSCPSLSSFDMDCQHIAAVLIKLYHEKKQDTKKKDSLNEGSSLTNELSEGLLQAFQEKSVPISSHQRYFENRNVLEVAFFCKVITVTEDFHLFGMEISIESNRLKDIRKFLEHVKKGKRQAFENGIVYDPKKHCFDKETDAIVQGLIRIMDDEKLYRRALSNDRYRKTRSELLEIPASSWNYLYPLLERVSQVSLEYDGKSYIGFHESEETLPLIFTFEESENSSYQLSIQGLHQIKIMKEYDMVLFDGKVVTLNRENIERLVELKRIISKSESNQVPIPEHQWELYMERILPSLRKMGEVHLSSTMTDKVVKTPLKANLYLDRVKNRLLVGLEFQYDQVIINPLDKRKIQVGSMVIRDTEKEDEILALIKESQFNTTESGYFLHNEELEYTFLYHILPKLQKLVQVYATSAVRTRIFRKNTMPKIKVKHRKERTNWLEFTFDMDGIPQREIKEVLEALEEKRKYYRLKDGALLSLEKKEFEEIQRFLHATPIQANELEKGVDMPVVQGLRLLDSVGNEDTFYLEESFHQFLEEIRSPNPNEFNVPNELENTLHDYQKLGVRWMKTIASFGFGGVLADDMGLGKTIQSIAYILMELSAIRKQKLPVLIVCPSSVTYNWMSELMKFAPDINAVVIDGKREDRQRLQKKVEDLDVLITSYPLLRNDITWYEKQPFHTVFFDEAQVFKNPLTQTFRSVKELNANHRFALTGTPMENSLEELWAIFHVVFPELFLGLKEYSELTRKQISRRIRPFMLRRVKEDVLHELPEKVEDTEVVELFPEQKKLYGSYLAKLKEDSLKHLDKDTFRKNKIRILAGLTRLRQICCHPVLFVDGYKGNSAKLKMLMEILRDAKDSGRRVLIFSQFTSMLRLVGKELAYQGTAYFYLDGETPSEERLKQCNCFNKGQRNVFLISLKAGGTGLNLTGADTVIFYDSWWNPAVEEQAADRAHRIGQKKSVKVIKLVAKGTIEEKMIELQKKKRHLIEEVVNANDNGDEMLTEEDIRELLHL